MTARNAARIKSNARISGQSIFIKRYHGEYRLIGVQVTKKQRKCRDIFADAQKLASYEMKKWNLKRHWGRLAKIHKVKGAHRMAVSYFYKLLKENDSGLDEILKMSREKRYTESRCEGAMVIDFAMWNKKENEASPFFFKKFGVYEEYYGALMRLAG